ncbi:MAG: general secretion pathway protein GspK [Lentisphaeria bacterium]|nr:general secretion pathway protein GspK [Lentisphaeria bacterium]
MKARQTTVGTTRRGRQGAAAGQSGMALLLTLGFLCVLLMLVLTLALTSRTERQAAAASADSVRGRLLAESALGEAVARLTKDFRGVQYPADEFYAPSESSSWGGRQYLASRDQSDSRAGLEQSLAVRLGECVFTPEASLADGAGWVPILSKRFLQTPDGPVSREVVVGRYSYLVIDESGKIDPGAVVRRGVAESLAQPVAGHSVTELALTNVGFADADRFCPESTVDEISGTMPTEESRWFSMAHMVKALGLTQSEMDLAVRTLFPFSFDKEQFWRDRDNDGEYDSGEEVDRLDVRAFPELSKVYHTFVGPQQDYGHTNDAGKKDAGYDDCAWLKGLDDNPWFTSWKTRAFAAYSEPERTYRARALAAAQVAANIVDFTDPDNEPTVAYLDNDGQIHIGVGNLQQTVVGTERTWALSQIAMRVEGDVTIEEENTTSEAGEDVVVINDIPFDIYNGAVVPQEDYEATITILGTNLSMYEDGEFLYTCPITTGVKLGSLELTPWGPLNDPVNANVNDENNPRSYDIPLRFNAGTPISLMANFWKHPVDEEKGKIDWKEWELSEALASTDLATALEPPVRVLRKGDPVPWAMQQLLPDMVEYYVQEYVGEDGRIAVQPNQAICLFQPTGGTYQALAILVTLKESDGRDIVNTKKVTFAIGGEVNLNPSNAEWHEFQLTTVDGEPYEIFELRDDILKQPTTYNAKHVRLIPKGNGNANGLTWDGEVYELQNGKMYDFHCETGMKVVLWNDLYDSKGRAMGKWWLGFAEAEKTIITIDGLPYYEELDGTTESGNVTTVTTDPGTPADSTALGNRLRVRAGFKAELCFPWATDAQLLVPPKSVEVAYKLEIGTVTGKQLTYSGIRELSATQAANADGGTLLWTADFEMDDWLTIENAFDVNCEPPLIGYTITQARILKVIIKDELDKAIDIVPIGSQDLCTFAGAEPAFSDKTFDAGLTAIDPFMNDRGLGAPDYLDFWRLSPETGVMHPGEGVEPTGFGAIDSCYRTGTYAGIDVQNSLVARLGELGRVHSFLPNRSLRFWSATSGDEKGHDAGILDVFKVGNQTSARGRVNVNSRQRDVLVALFTGALDVDPEAAADAILVRRAEGESFRSLGDFFGGVSQITPSNPGSDAEAEQAAMRLAEKVTVRSNFFTVIVCAQAVQDVAGVPYRTEDGDTMVAQFGRFDVAKGGRYVDPVQAERKAMAVVYRDALTNETRIERLEFLDD